MGKTFAEGGYSPGVGGREGVRREKGRCRAWSIRKSWQSRELRCLWWEERIKEGHQKDWSSSLEGQWKSKECSALMGEGYWKGEGRPDKRWFGGQDRG